MWKCPKCGREFKNTDQGHYCGEKPKTIDEYIAAQDEDRRPALMQMRRILSDALPNAQERISWSMPTFWQGYNVCHFAAFKKHIGFYPGPAAVEAFAEELTAYKTDKGTIRFPYDGLNADLISRIAAWCVTTGNHA